LLKVIANQRHFPYFLALLTVAVYAQSVHFDFLNFDDNFYITLNPYIEQGINWSSIQWAWSPFGNDYDPYYMPLTWVSFLLDAQIFGVNPAGFHFTNMLLHLANTLLVLYILNKMTGRYWESAAVATLFAIHPQHVEAVVWIAERKEVLSALFGLLALACYANYFQQHLSSWKKRLANRYYLLTFLFFFLSLLTKPTMVTLPCLLLLIDWWPLNRLKKESLATLIIEKIPFLLLSALLALIILPSLGTEEAHAIITSQTIPLEQRIGNVFLIYVCYLENTFLPLNMPGWYPYPLDALPNWKIYSAAGILISITLITSLLSRKQPYLLMGWAWFIGLLLPAASVGVYANGDVFIADRWTYLPHIGLFISIIWYLSYCIQKWPRYRSGMTVLIVISLLLLSATSWHQMKNWSDSETFWLHIVEADKDLHFPHFMLGTYYRDIGKVDESLEHFYKAHNDLPTEPYYSTEIGNAYFAKGQEDKAWKYYDQVLSLPNVDNSFLTRVGVFYTIQKRLDSAKTFFYKILEKPHLITSKYDPFYHQAHFYLGNIFAMSGDNDEALNYFTEYVDNINDNREAQCAKALILMSGLMEYGLSNDDLDRPFKLLTQLCK
jgi:tetratricopeptide (TPR) repeat protein